MMEYWNELDDKMKLILLGSVFGGVALLLGGAEYYFIWYDGIQPLEKEVKKLEGDINSMKNKIKQIETLKDRRNELLKLNREISKILPSTEEVPATEFMEELHDIAQKVGVEPQSYTPNNRGGNSGRGGRGGSSNKGYETINFDIEVTGEIYPLFRYIWALEHKQRLIRVNKFDLSISQQEVPVESASQDGQINVGTSNTTNQENQPMETVYIGSLSLNITIYSYVPPESQ